MRKTFTERSLFNNDYAVYSPNKQYRYVLSRAIPSNFDRSTRWRKPIAFLMLNPSTATAMENDPTIRRCIGFAEREGYNRLYIVNLFGMRATDPKDLASAYDPVGPANDDKVHEIITSVNYDGGPIIAAWGANPVAEERAEQLLEHINAPLHCLGLTKKGAPRHPLYISSKQPFTLYRSAK